MLGFEVQSSSLPCKCSYLLTQSSSPEDCCLNQLRPKESCGMREMGSWFSYLFPFFHVIEGNTGKQRLNFNLKPVREREKKNQCGSSLDKFEWSKSAWIYKIIKKMWTRFQECSDNATKVRKYTEILMEKFWEVNGKFQIIWGHGGDYILLKVFALKKKMLVGGTAREWADWNFGLIQNTASYACWGLIILDRYFPFLL